MWMKKNTRILECINQLMFACRIPSEPMSISQVVDFEISRRGVLAELILDAREDFDREKWESMPLSSRTTYLEPIGLNTIGMLVDRLSILVIKSVIQKKVADVQLQEQIDEMLVAIQFCRDGKSSSFNKVTNIESSNSASHPVEIVLQLAYINLLLWLAQDVLYLRGAGALPDEELRAYIGFFAEKNVLRNELISRLATTWHFPN